MAVSQNDMERIKDKLAQGLITVAQANVQMVLIGRFRLIKGSLPASVRSVLNAAVKSGELGHIKKEKFKPEAYFHPTFKHLAMEARAIEHNNALAAIAGVLGSSNFN